MNAERYLETIQPQANENIFLWLERTERGIIVSSDISVYGRMYSLEAYLMAQVSIRRHLTVQ